MTRITLSILFASFLGFLSLSPLLAGDEEVLDINGAVLKKNPTRLPIQIPEAFHYPGAENLLSGTAGSGIFLSSTEGAVLLSTADRRDTVEKYYEEVIQRYGWTIIQSHKSDEGTLIMSESSFRKLVTVVLRGDGPTQIKIYYKQSGSD